MSLPENVVTDVRRRANFACEYCGVTETDAGGLLTVDHFLPRARGGTDEAENLLYCCFRCNLHKADYWPTRPGDPVLWNPRVEQSGAHFLHLDDGRLLATTPTGMFTISRLRLNREPLIALRRKKRQQDAEFTVLRQLHDLLMSLQHLYARLLEAEQENRELLREQRALLRRLTGATAEENESSTES
jgi:hypothetical protein